MSRFLDKSEESEEEPPEKRLRLEEQSNTEDKIKITALAMAKSMLSDSSDSDDDDCETLMLFLMIRKMRKRKLMLLKELETISKEAEECKEDKDYFEDVVPQYDDKEFLENFRINQNLYEDICKSFAESKFYTVLRRDQRTPAEKQIAVFLWFAGQESCSLSEVGERFDLSKSTVCIIIERVTMYLASLAPQKIVWSSEQKKFTTSRFFKEVFTHFPRAIGCLGCTYITIPPSDANTKDSIDEHGNFNIYIQAVCDGDRKFLDLFVSNTGSSNRNDIYASSPLKNKIHELCGDYYLLANSNYLGNSNLITPYRGSNPIKHHEAIFNQNLMSASNYIKHAFCMLKQRFRQLQFCKLPGKKKLCDFITACCVLHNMADKDDFDFDYVIINSQHVPDRGWGETYNDDTILETNAVRDEIAKNMNLCSKQKA